MAHGVSDRLVGFALIGVAYTVVGGVGALVLGLPPSAAWPFVLASALIHVIYTVLLWASYQLGEFSQVYPVARGTAPLVVAVIEVVLGHVLPVLQLVGIVVISLGLISLALDGGRLSRAALPALGAAVATGICIAGYTVIDAGAVSTTPVLVYAAWMFLLQGPVMPLIALLRRGPRLRTQAWPVLVAGSAAAWCRSRPTGWCSSPRPAGPPPRSPRCGKPASSSGPSSALCSSENASASVGWSPPRWSPWASSWSICNAAPDGAAQSLVLRSLTRGPRRWRAQWPCALYGPALGRPSTLSQPARRMAGSIRQRTVVTWRDGRRTRRAEEMGRAAQKKANKVVSALSERTRQTVDESVRMILLHVGCEVRRVPAADRHRRPGSMRAARRPPSATGPTDA